MYFLEVDPASGTLSRLRMAPMQTRRFRLNRAVLDREGQPLGSLELRW